MDFYIGLVELLGRMSFQLTANNTTILDPTWKFHPYQCRYRTYTSEAKEQLVNYYNKHIKDSTVENGIIYLSLSINV